MIVADTNLVAYLLIRSPQSDFAAAVLLRDPAWAAPVLWKSEFRNVLTHYLRQRQLGLPEALEYMQEAEALLNGREYEVPSAPVLQLAERSGCSADDCEFVHLAQQLSVPLVTSDRKLLQSFPGVAVSLEGFAES